MRFNSTFVLRRARAEQACKEEAHGLGITVERPGHDTLLHLRQVRARLTPCACLWLNSCLSVARVLNC